jgi:hypothetical protein
LPSADTFGCTHLGGCDTCNTMCKFLVHTHTSINTCPTRFTCRGISTRRFHLCNQDNTCACLDTMPHYIHTRPYSVTAASNYIAENSF